MPAISTRTDLVIPAELVAVLDIPPLAVTDATPDPEWVEVPLGEGRYRRRPSQRLPLDPRTAESTRRFNRLAPFGLPTALVAAAILLIIINKDDLPPALWLTGLLAYVGTMSGWAQVVGGLPKQRPRRLLTGELRIPEVPVEVAEQWVVRNPGVSTTDEPMPWPHPRRYYARLSLGLVAGAIALFTVLAVDGREDSILLWALTVVLLGYGVLMALRTQARRKAKYTLLG